MHDLDEAIRLGCPVVVHTVDINRFKDINDTLGAATGDEILRQVARRLQTLGTKQSLLARLAGDEFALAEIVRNMPAGDQDGASHHHDTRRDVSPERPRR